MEAYLAVPSMGAVLHTLNLRLFPEQLAYVINHGEDLVVIADGSVLPLLARVAGLLETVRHFVVVGPADPRALAEAVSGLSPRPEIHDYEESSGRGPDSPGPTSTNGPARRCATRAAPPGTPRASCTRTAAGPPLHGRERRQRGGAEEYDRALLIVRCSTPTRGACRTRGGSPETICSWPGAAYCSRAVVAMIEGRAPDRRGRGAHNLVRRAAPRRSERLDLSSCASRCAGAPPPPLADGGVDEGRGVRVIQGWGMTETSPLAALAFPPRGVPLGTAEEMDGGPAPVGSSEGSSCASSATTTPPPLGRRRGGRDRGEGPGVTSAYHRDPSPRSSTRAGCAPATSGAPSPTASSRSPMGQGRHQERVASGSPR